MKSFYLLLWILNGVVEVLGNDTSVPYELLFFYSSYKQEWKTSPNARTIATGCRHTPLTVDPVSEDNFIAATVSEGLEGICTFDEFAKWVGGQNFARYPRDPVGNTLYPNTVATRLKNKIRVTAVIFRQPIRINVARLLPNEGFRGNTPYTQVLHPTMNIIQQARTTAGNVGGTLLTAIETEGAECMRLLTIAFQFRWLDQWNFLNNRLRNDPSVASFRGRIANNRVNIFDFDGTNTGQGYTEIDFDTTRRQLNAVEQGSLDDLVRGFMNDPRTRIHIDVIRTMSQGINVLNQRIDTPCRAPATRRKRSVTDLFLL